MPEKKPLLETVGLTKEFMDKDKHTVIANDNINLKVYPGETLGIVGESGCGKSTLIKQIVGMLNPTKGAVIYDGKDISKMSKKEKHLLRKDIQMIFQDPGTAFNPRMKIGNIITEPLLNYKLISKGEREEVAKKYLKLVGLPESFINRYPHELSGGQRQRVGIARALTLKPKIILCDEVTSALDVSVQESIVELLKKLQKELGISYIFITHDLALVDQLADKTVVMYKGKIVEELDKGNLKDNVTHPYSKALLDAVFEPGSKREPRLLKGEVDKNRDDSEGCIFVERCPEKKDLCDKTQPDLFSVSHDHKVACNLLSGSQR